MDLNVGLEDAATNKRLLADNTSVGPFTCGYKWKQLKSNATGRVC